MITSSLYLIIGVVFTIFYWNYKYDKDYQIAKAAGYSDDAMTCIFLMIFTICWPGVMLYALYEYYDKRR